MKINAAFWDTSALVPLCSRQPATSTANRLARQYRKIEAWWGTVVEAQSALARLLREKQINDVEFKHAMMRLRQLRQSWSEILPTEEVRDLAGTLLIKHSLRAADSFQLAAALVWCDGKPRKRPFICFDVRLAEAAQAAGFEVHPII